MSVVLTSAAPTGRGSAVADAALLVDKCGPGLNNMWDAESKVRMSAEQRATESHRMVMFESRTKQLEMLLAMPYLSQDERQRVQKALFDHVMGGLIMPAAMSSASTGRKRAASQALECSDDDGQCFTPSSNDCRASLHEVLERESVSMGGMHDDGGSLSDGSPAAGNHP